MTGEWWLSHEEIANPRFDMLATIAYYLPLYAVMQTGQGASQRRCALW
jgi:hypothetical protein